MLQIFSALALTWHLFDVYIFFSVFYTGQRPNHNNLSVNVGFFFTDKKDKKNRKKYNMYQTISSFLLPIYGFVYYINIPGFALKQKIIGVRKQCA